MRIRSVSTIRPAIFRHAGLGAAWLIGPGRRPGIIPQGGGAMAGFDGL
jgi:hypothetical protein